jgi:beta-lactamase class A
MFLIKKILPQKTVNLKHWQIFLIIIITIMINILVSKILQNQENYLRENIEKHEFSNYKYISPLLECADENSLYEHQLENKLKKIINHNIASNKVKLVSLYYRNLNNGPWIGINENEEFSPASLLKMPLMISYFKIAESKKEILQEKIKMHEQADVVAQNISPQKKAIEGKEYTVEELIELMIIYSDNNASNTLIQYIENTNPGYLDKVYQDLGIDMLEKNKLENFMKIKDYSSFFRILYNSSYLNREMSEKALRLLSKSNFNEGLRADIPSYINISHKFGERVLSDSQQLHDCGIVYQPKQPYLLCIMTRGDSLDSLSEVIQEISQVVYKESYLK